MKKAVAITLAVLIISLMAYVGLRIYSNYIISSVNTPLQDAINSIKNPSFTIDPFNDTDTLPTIKTSVQSDLETMGVSFSDVYNSGYFEPFDYTME